MFRLARARSVVVALATGALLAGCGGGPDRAPATAEEHQARPPAPGHASAHGQHRFERAEDWARLFDHPSRAAWQKPDEVVALLGLTPGMTVVDVGAGTGYFLSRLSRAVGVGGVVVATDIEPDMVRYMKERAAREGLGNVQAIAAPMAAVGVPDESADRILVVDVWHHLADRESYAAQVAKVLRPGGAVAIVDFTLEATRGPPRHHRLAPEVIVAELRAGGLVAELVAETLPDQYVVIGRKAATGD